VLRFGHLPDSDMIAPPGWVVLERLKLRGTELSGAITARRPIPGALEGHRHDRAALRSPRAGCGPMEFMIGAKIAGDRLAP